MWFSKCFTLHVLDVGYFATHSWESGSRGNRVHSSCSFEARQPFVTRREVICGGRLGRERERERPGATGQHSRANTCFLSQRICFGITRDWVEQLVEFAGKTSSYFCFFSHPSRERGCRLTIAHLWPWANTRSAVKRERSRGLEACMSCLPLTSQNNRKECRFYYRAKIKLSFCFWAHFFLEFYLKTLHNLEPDALALASHFSNWS